MPRSVVASADNAETARPERMPSTATGRSGSPRDEATTAAKAEVVESEAGPTGNCRRSPPHPPRPRTSRASGVLCRSGRSAHPISARASASVTGAGPARTTGEVATDLGVPSMDSTGTAATESEDRGIHSAGTGPSAASSHTDAPALIAAATVSESAEVTRTEMHWSRTTGLPSVKRCASADTGPERSGSTTTATTASPSTHVSAA